MYLYLDTSFEVRMGLWDPSNKQWKDYQILQTRKSSPIIHTELLQFLNRNYLTVQQLQGLVGGMGPGGYTGIRLCRGISDMFHLLHYRVTHYYLHHLPMLWAPNQQPPRGIYLDHAYKGECFIYRFGQSETHPTIYSLKELEALDTSLPFYFPTEHVAQSFIEMLKFEKYFLVLDELKLHFAQVFNHLKLLEPFYFRPPHQEFKVTCTPL